VVEALRALEAAQAPPAPSPAGAPAAAGHRARPPRRRRLAAAVAAALLGGFCLGAAAVSLTTRHGTLVVNVSEPGARVFVDGEEKVVVDSTKVGRVELIPGEHRLTVRRGEEEVFTEAFALRRGQEVVLTARWDAGDAGQPRPEPARPADGPAAPADALRRETIPAEDLAAAGSGDPGKAPDALVAVLGDSRLKHWTFVTSVAFSPDGKSLASADNIGWVVLWETATGRARLTLRDRASGGGPTTVAFSPDGKLLASGLDQRILLWDTATGQEKRTMQGNVGVKCLAFSPDGKTLAADGADGTILLFDLDTGKPGRTIARHKARVVALAFGPDGKVLASGSEDRTAKLLDVASGQELRSVDGYSGWYGGVAFSADGKTLATAGADAVKLWDPTAWRQRQSIPFRNTAVALSADGGTVACASPDGGPVLFDAATGKPRGPCRGHLAGVQCVALSPDGKLVASGGRDGQVLLWDIAGGAPAHSPSGHAAPVWSVAFSPDGRLLASASMDCTARLWALDTAKEVRGLRHHADRNQVEVVAFAPDGKVLASGGNDGSVVLSDPTTGNPLRRLQGHPGGVSSLAFSPDSRLLVTGGADRQVRLWDVAAGTPLGAPWVDAESPIKSLALGNGLAAAAGKNIWLAKAPEKELPRPVKLPSSPVAALALGPDGRALLVGTSEGLWLLDRDGERAEAVALLPQPGGIRALAVASSNGLVAGSTGNGRVSLWQPGSVRPSRSWQLPGPVHGVALSADGRYLATANGNGTVYLFRVAPAAPGPADRPRP
jgi:WD40 repeat protein